MNTLLPLISASLLAGLIGAEREAEGKAAGFRTHLLIGLGAALLSLLSIEAARGAASEWADPGRIAAQIVSGIGFVGAGAIIQSRASVRGITTAATLWVAAAIGMACGFQQYLPAVIVTMVGLFSLRVLAHLDPFFERRPRWHTLEIISDRGQEWTDALVQNVLNSADIRSWMVDRSFVSEGRYGCLIRTRARKREIVNVLARLYRDGEGGIFEARIQ